MGRNKIPKQQNISAQNKTTKTATQSKRSTQATKRSTIPSSNPSRTSSFPTLPPFMKIPRDEEDDRFTKSFRAPTIATDGNVHGDETQHLAELLEFFDTYGFVVFRDVCSEDGCESLKSDMWGFIEEKYPGFSRHDDSTWDKWKGKSYGMPQMDPIFTKEFLRMRQSETMYGCFRALFDASSGDGADEKETDEKTSPSKKINERNIADKKSPPQSCYPNDLIVNHDRWLLYRKSEEFEDGTAEENVSHTGRWKTRRNLHLDMDPWQYYDGGSDTNAVSQRLKELKYEDCNLINFIQENNDVVRSFGLSVQAILNVNENLDGDGGTLVIPGFHRHHEEFFTQHSPNAMQKMKFAGRFLVDECNPMQKLGQRVPMRAGSMLVWDQRLIHGSAPNKSSNCRFGIPVKVFSRKILEREGNYPSRMEARAKTVLDSIEKSGFLDEISDTGLATFGLRGTETWRKYLEKLERSEKRGHKKADSQHAKEKRLSQSRDENNP